jgi:hypothetical protein
MNRNTRNNQMTKHFTHSKLWTMAVALALVLGSALLLSGQDAKPKRGIPKDWSMHHVVFSKPGASVPAARLQKLLKDPRYIIQQELRAAMAAPPSLPAPLAALENGPEPDISTAPLSGPLPRGLTKALIPPTGKEPLPTTPNKRHRRLHKDWSVSEGTNGTTGVGQFPATFTQTATPCATDLAIYNTGLGGSGSQATVVGYNNIYAACTGPTVYYAYNTGTAPITTSVDLSEDGGQLAFITGASGSAASLVVLRPSTGGTVASPSSATPVAAASYNGCTAPCQTTIALSGSPSDSYSSPFYDYASDTLYVGDDGGKLHKFTGVFGETYSGGVLTPTAANPAEVTTGGWPVQVSSATVGGALGSPVYDASTGLAFVGDYLLNYASTCEPSATNSNGSCGYIYSVNSAGTVVKSAQFDYQYGIVDSPIVDPTTALIFGFVGADNSTSCSSGPCAAVVELDESFVAASTGASVQVGAGYEFMLSGAFDNNYFNTGTGNLYVVGGTGPQNNTLYAVGVTSGIISGPATKGPAIAANYTNGFYAGGLQVTEFYTGTFDYIFAGALMATTTPTVGLVSGYDVTSGTITTSTPATGTILAQGGPSGIVVDNSLFTAQNIYYSTTLNAACTTSGTGGCAVQVIQSAP